MTPEEYEQYLQRMECWNCHEKGHKKVDCPNEPADNNPFAPAPAGGKVP
jgi:hypothetical protein